MNSDIIIFTVIFVSLAGACIGISAFVLMKIGETKNPLLVSLEEEEKKSKGNNSSPKEGGFRAMLEKNNKLLSTWNTTEKAENELKMLQASGKTQE